MPKPTYDTTLARIAGNIAAGLVSTYGPFVLDEEHHTRVRVARVAVLLARAIVAQVRATEPETP